LYPLCSSRANDQEAKCFPYKRITADSSCSSIGENIVKPFRHIHLLAKYNFKKMTGALSFIKIEKISYNLEVQQAKPDRPDSTLPRGDQTQKGVPGNGLG
jgi:hypothetical protein